MMLGPIQVQPLVHSLAFAGVGVALLWLAHTMAHAMTPFNDNLEIAERRNVTVSVRTAGVLIGMVIGMIGGLAGPAHSFLVDLRDFAIDGVIVMAAIFVAKLVMWQLTLRGLSVRKALTDDNLAVGFLEAGAYIATGLILNGAFAGEGAVASGLIYAAIGQAALILSFWLYEWVSPIRVREEIIAGNRAAGLLLGARLVATGMILQAAIAGPMTDWTTDLTQFGAYFVFGMALLGVANLLADFLFLPGIRIRAAVEEQRNLAAIVKVAGVQLALAAIVMVVQ